MKLARARNLSPRPFCFTAISLPAQRSPYFARKTRENSTLYYFTHSNFDGILDFVGIRISSTFSVRRPFSYLRPCLYFDRYLLRLPYFDLCTLPFCQIRTSYWSRSTGRTTVLVEVKSVGRSTEKVEDMKMVEVQMMRTLKFSIFNIIDQSIDLFDQF